MYNASSSATRIGIHRLVTGVRCYGASRPASKMSVGDKCQGSLCMQYTHTHTDTRRKKESVESKWASAESESEDEK